MTDPMTVKAPPVDPRPEAVVNLDVFDNPVFAEARIGQPCNHPGSSARGSGSWLAWLFALFGA